MCHCTGCGSTAVVQSAVCTTNNERVAIKRIDLDQYTGSIEELQVGLCDCCQLENELYGVVHLHTHTRARTHTRTHTHACMHACTHIHAHIHTHARMHTHTAYAHTCTHK